ncbi:MAG TPA: DUF481 domain-containing protein [Verrucomicrobiae bacterium]
MARVKAKISAFAACLFALALFPAHAQPVVIVTNYVTVYVTNIVTVTNIVSAVPAVPAARAAVAAAARVAAKPGITNYPWKSSVSVGLTLARGNSDTMLFTADYATQRKTPFDEYSISLAGAYGDQNAKETANNLKAAAQWNHLFSERFFSYLRTDGLRDLIADVDYRLTIGPGVGYYLLKTTNTTLAVETGMAFEAQRLHGKGDDTFVTARLGERFERKFNEHARIWESAEILPQVDKLDNYSINFEIGVETVISKSFSLKTFFDDNYNRQPARGKLKNDAKIVSAVSYKF